MSVNKVSIKLLTITILSLTVLSHAQAVEKSYFAFELGQATIDDAVASEQGIKNSANYFRLAFEKQYDSWIIGGGMSGFLYSDNEGFSQQVVNQFGSQKSASSTASSTNVFIDGGYVYPLNESMSVDLLAGFEYVASSTRSISNCSDCAKADINVGAGAYVAPRIAYEWDNGFKLGFFYRQFLSGDVKSTLGLNFAWRY